MAAEFPLQMLTPQQVNSPVGERQGKKPQDHQSLPMRANHAELQRVVCYILFFSLLLQCFGRAQLRYISVLLFSKK